MIRLPSALPRTRPELPTEPAARASHAPRRRSATLAVVAVSCLAGCEAGVGEGDGIVDEDEVPSAGWTAELIGTAHDVAGTAVLGDDSIELRDLVYDGGGVDARGLWGIPWHSKTMKDAVTGETLRGVGSKL